MADINILQAALNDIDAEHAKTPVGDSGGNDYYSGQEYGLRLACILLDKRIKGASSPPGKEGWRSAMENAPKDGSRILARIRSDLVAHTGRKDLERWAGIPFVASHPGLAEDGFDIGWRFAAPVGHGGFPDDWFDGWMPLPSALFRHGAET